MYFKASGRTNPGTKKYDSYYRLVESYRNETVRVCHRTILIVGFLDDELTPEQLNLIARTKGYHNLCVSRAKLKNYKYAPKHLKIYLETKSKKEVIISKIQTPDNTDYCVEIQSQMKAVKERGMKTQFETRYEEELTKIRAYIQSKGGVKLADKVNQRIGRAKQKYPSAQGRYKIQLSYDEKNKYY